MADVTQILNAIERGNPNAAEELLPLVYNELRHLAAQKMSQEQPGQTLQATALVHEAYIRLVEVKNQSWNSRGHFFKAAAEAMRRVLVENARRKKRQKYGGDQQKVDLEDAVMAIEEPAGDIIAIDESLEKLAQKDPLATELIKLRYFAGLTLEQASKMLDISPRTADRYWAYARAWLYREITKEKQ